VEEQSLITTIPAVSAPMVLSKDIARMCGLAATINNNGTLGKGL